MITMLIYLITLVAHDDDQHGQGLAEYALILGLIAAVAIIALTLVGNSISGALTTVGNTL